MNHSVLLFLQYRCGISTVKKGTARHLSVLLIITMMMTACAPATDSPSSRIAKAPTVSEQSNQAFLALADRHASRIFAVSPEWATQLGVTEEIAGAEFASRLSDFSRSGNADLVALNQELLAELRQVDRAVLTGTAAVTYEVMLNAYEVAARQNAFGVGMASLLWVNPPYAVDQLFGQQIAMPRFFTAQMPVTSEKQLRDYLRRLDDLGPAMSDVAKLLEDDAKKGVVPPRFVLSAVAKSARGFADDDINQHPIMVYLVRALDAMSALSEAERRVAAQQARTVIASQVVPAFDQFASAVEGLIHESTDEPGIWRLPDGDKMYQVALDGYGATGMTADEIHRLGLRDVRRIHAEMNQILLSLGYPTGAVGERMKLLSTNPEYLYPNTDQAKADILRELEAHIQNMLKVAPHWFETVPPQPIVVKRIPAYEEASSSGAYYTPPTLDASQPGTFWINLKDTADWPRYTFESLVYHEAVPGHHFQASIQQEIDDMPLIRQMMWFADYGEGWALYTEALAVEMGMYDNDPLGNLGRLRMELYRAVRLVVDTGLHHKRWTRQQAIDWMVEATGETESSIAREIDRYAVWPGQATSYKIGMIQFQRIRDKAERALGDRFDIRGFHNELLTGGAMPMAVLEARMDRWIARQGAVQ